ncbi:hypothetical protein D3C78_1524500 [compost metagenome]
MPEGVVYRLEMIQIQHNYGELFAAAHGLAQGISQDLIQSHTVEHPREVIGHGHPCELLILLFQLSLRMVQLLQRLLGALA